MDVYVGTSMETFQHVGSPIQHKITVLQRAQRKNLPSAQADTNYPPNAYDCIATLAEFPM